MATATRASTSTAELNPDFITLLINKLNEMRTEATNISDSNLCKRLTGTYLQLL